MQISKQKTIDVSGVKFGNELPLSLILGPCVVESRDHAMFMADRLCNITKKLGFGFVFKSSFDKANRTSINSGRGIGLERTLKIFQEIKSELKCPVVTDVHLPDQCALVAEVVDMLQIPAFLCRQTDLLVAAAKTKKPLNIKKGQFLAPWDIIQATEKVAKNGNDNIMVCERGAMFGYNNLVVDMRSLPIMSATGYPVIFDGTHSVQIPGGLGVKSGGQREFIPILSRAAVAAGVAGVFLEVHNNPDQAPCDGTNMLRLDDLESLLTQLRAVDRTVKGY
ncbi:MAG: 3-deoxy-8-phosphooctulonate synthase [Holosporales bacterium]|jgi:2-dehydro-3-deoxyphosphooctonate aldolase (KDO 8-P synthase)|nr:3-deoxy-8-phosphooctulonate synthase [Holosporales bacterium]